MAGGYVGTAEDKRRIVRQEKEREEAKKKFEDAKSVTTQGLREFGTGTSELHEHAFKAETVGLVTREEFVQKRDTIAERMQDAAKARRAEAEEAAWQEKERIRAKKDKAALKHKLSFDDFGEEDEEEQQPPAAARPEPAAGASSAADVEDADGGDLDKAKRRRYATLGKNPDVSADFLPDRDRDHEEHEMRERLKAEWGLRTAAIKAEPLEITYSYWNGTGHRRTVTVRKGDTVAQFLRAVLEQMAPTFRELRGLSASALMYIKEDIILPQTVSFYDLIVNRAQGKSGPLFQFDVAEHAAMTFDPRMKSKDTHAGKVVDRHWYNKNKHIFPASRWETYDPDKAAAAGQEADAQQGPPGR